MLQVYILPKTTSSLQTPTDRMSSLAEIGKYPQSFGNLLCKLHRQLTQRIPHESSLQVGRKLVRRIFGSSLHLSPEQARCSRFMQAFLCVYSMPRASEYRFRTGRDSPCMWHVAPRKIRQHAEAELSFRRIRNTSTPSLGGWSTDLVWLLSMNPEGWKLQ